jgi:hypothetical protein
MFEYKGSAAQLKAAVSVAATIGKTPPDAVSFWSAGSVFSSICFGDCTVATGRTEKHAATGKPVRSLPLKNIKLVQRGAGS